MNRRSTPISATWLAAVALLFGPLAVADPNTDWPQFRGPNRNGVSSETGLLSGWPAAGPSVVWRRPIGEGFSAITVVGGRLYSGYADATPWDPANKEPAGEEYAAAFDAATGEELWRTVIGAKTFDEFGHGPRATPTVDGDRVYVLGGNGLLAALSTADGGKLWTVDLGERFTSPRTYYGHSTSVIVEDGVVILDVGGPEGKSYAGLSRASGETLWTTGEAVRGAGYGSVLPVELAGEHQLIYVTGQKLRSISSAGIVHWEVDWPRGETHAMPVFIPPDKIFASGAGDVGAIVHRIAKQGDGYAVEEAWRSHLMKNHFSSSLYHQGYLYGFDNATLKCIDASTGEQKWAKRGLGKGSLIAVDGHLIVLSDRGQLLLVEATPSGYVEQGSVQAMTGKCWTAPVLAGGRVYLRNHQEMVVYQLNG